jgi:tRNA modification GTPase
LLGTLLVPGDALFRQTPTIAALATPTGRGGIGVIRVSGSQVPQIAQIITGKTLKPRQATFTSFFAVNGAIVDQGIALYFPAPHSFTGEAVLELQGHGGPVVMDQLLQAVLAQGAHLARPGEFSERAFLNGKIDLAQAEAIADLIDSASVQAAKCALRSLQGEFSAQIHALVKQLTQLRAYIEAGIDFVEEEIDLLADNQVVIQITTLIHTLEILLTKAQQGLLLKEGVRLALVGEVNVGKSSLLNQLTERETAIVTPLPGTTRDIVQAHIQIDGIPLQVMDTAGLRETADFVEREGIRRTQQALAEADVVILLLDDTQTTRDLYPPLLADLAKTALVVHNKIDLSGQVAGLSAEGHLYISAKTGAGIAALKQAIKEKIGVHTTIEGNFMARRRHLEALRQARQYLHHALTQAEARQSELLAEELRLAQQVLGEITGEVTTEDLLNLIFSTFCIGK